MIRNWITSFVTGFIGLVAGILLADRLDEPAPAPVAVHAVPAKVTPPSTTSVATLTVDDLRRVIREELTALAAHQASASAPPARAAAIEPQSELTAEQSATVQQAQALLQSAITRRQWTDADAEALRTHLHNLPGPEQLELLRQFSVAVNQGRIVPESDQLPF